ncbi:MAG: twin-arginine translocase TatA/TatE family subunit [Salinibacter sp.]
MGSFGGFELVIIFAVVLLIFGAKRIPEIARGIGKGIREFKDATSEISREIEAEGQNRQINQPQSPQQGAPQPRQGRQHPQQAASQQGSSGSASAETAEGTPKSTSTDSSDAPTQNQKNSS